MHSTKRLHIVVLLILALLGAGAIYIVLRPEQPAPIIGMVRTTEVVIAPEIGGQSAPSRFARATMCAPVTYWPNFRRPS